MCSKCCGTQLSSFFWNVESSHCLPTTIWWTLKVLANSGTVGFEFFYGLNNGILFIKLRTSTLWLFLLNIYPSSNFEIINDMRPKIVNRVYGVDSINPMNLPYTAASYGYSTAYAELLQQCRTCTLSLTMLHCIRPEPLNVLMVNMYMLYRLKIEATTTSCATWFQL